MVITAHEYNLGLVLLSYVVAVIASFTALELARRVTRSEDRSTAYWWLAAGACSMGIGIWSMHFVGMLAYDPHMPVSYDLPITVLSMMVAMISSGFALFIGSRGSVSAGRLAASGVAMGAGIAAMHYTGMAAMRMEPVLHYKPGLFLLSIVIAVVVATIALWLVFKFSSHAEEVRFRYKAGAALVMGLAVCGMHYTGMEAAYYVSATPLLHAAAPFGNLWLASSVVIATLVILGATLLVIFFDRKLSVQTALGKQLEQLVARRTAELFLEKERAEVTLDSIADAVITTDAHSHIQHLNPVAEQLTGWHTREAKGMLLSEVLTVVNEVTREPAGDLAAMALREGHPITVSAHTVLLARDGREYAIDESAAPIHDREGHALGAVLVFRDVSAKRELARQLSFEATHDALTGLINRREFEQRVRKALESAVGEGREHALMYMDLDQFKVVNDSCGHAAGDELLRRLSTVLSNAVRESDIVARLGGDEFGVLLRRCPPAVAKQISEKLRKLVEDFRFLWEGRTFTVGASIGLVAINNKSESLTQLLSAADSACYLAKESGRNTVRMYQESDAELAQRSSEMEWSTRIRRGLEENRFVFYYQRIKPLDNSNEDNQHFEILLRYRDEQGKLWPPMSFIPAAERYGLMPAVDRWVVANVLHTLAHDRTPGFTVSTCAINLSGQSLGENSFLAFVLEQLEKSTVDPKILCFEITETAAIANLERALKFVTTLRGRGCRFALDDFGSGLSSFAYLKNLPVDYLKIDGSFVQGMADNTLDDAIVLAICRIGRVLGIKTIAEFVENDHILHKLQEIGVDFAQGYGIGKPQPLSENAAITAMQSVAQALARS